MAEVVEYPKNLYNAVFGDHCPEGFEYPEDAAETVEYLISMIPRENMYAVMQYRFHDHLTYAAISEKIGRTKERIRQIILKCLRMLRHPSRYRILIIGISEYKRREDAKLKKLGELSDQCEDEEDPLAKVLDMNLSDFMKANIKEGRITKCLTTWMDADSTVRDLVKVMESREILNFHNFGKGSYQRLMDVLMAAGIPREMIDAVWFKSLVKTMSWPEKMLLPIAKVNQILDKPLPEPLVNKLHKAHLGTVSNVCILIENRAILEVPTMEETSMRMIEESFIDAKLIDPIKKNPTAGHPFIFYFRVFQDISKFKDLSEFNMRVNFNRLKKFMSKKEFEIIYDKFSLNMESTDIAKEMGISPYDVDQSVDRIIRFCRKWNMPEELLSITHIDEVLD